MSLCLPLLAVVAHAEVTIPPEHRLPAKVLAHLTAPADQPLRMPTDVAVDRAGRVLVADGVNDRVVRFTPDGRVDMVIRRVGPHELKNPVGLTVDAADRIWIADTDNHRLVVARADGALVEVIELPAGENGKPCDPTDVAVTPDGKRVIVVDNDNHRLLVRDLGLGGEIGSGAWTSLGKFGTSLGQFQWPFLIAATARGQVLVSDAVGGRVQRLDERQRWMSPVGRWGIELGQLYRPKGVAADAAGRIYVSDSTLNVVQVFGTSGGVLDVLCDEQGQPRRFGHAMGLAVGEGGKLYVVELAANRVTVLQVSVPAAHEVMGAATQPAQEIKVRP